MANNLECDIKYIPYKEILKKEHLIIIMPINK